MPRVHLLLCAFAAALATVACASFPLKAPGNSLRVMTYNIQYGNEGLDSVIAVIRAERPDIVGLQEVDVHWSPRSNFVDQAALLARGAEMDYRFARIYQIPSGDSTRLPREFGVAILSRYPIVDFTNRTITRLSTQDANPVAVLMPGLLDAAIDVRGRQIRVFDVHLDYRRDPQVRAKQVSEIVDYIGKSSVPTLLFGDLNARPDAAELQPLLQRLHDTWPYESGPGLTDPARNPAAKIDYVLMSDGFRVMKAWMPEVFASDHRPVVVDLVMKH